MELQSQQRYLSIQTPTKTETDTKISLNSFHNKNCLLYVKFRSKENTVLSSLSLFFLIPNATKKHNSLSNSLSNTSKNIELSQVLLYNISCLGLPVNSFRKLTNTCIMYSERSRAAKDTKVTSSTKPPLFEHSCQIMLRLYECQLGSHLPQNQKLNLSENILISLNEPVVFILIHSPNSFPPDNGSSVKTHRDDHLCEVPGT